MPSSFLVLGSRRRRGPRPFFSVLVAGVVLPFVLVLRSPVARGAELVVAAGPSFRASTWSGDYAAGGHVKAGLRLARLFEVNLGGGEELASVDRRLVTSLTLGLRLFWPRQGVRPWMGLHGSHQHEEGWPSVVDNPAGVLVGIGAGIRHRVGAGGSLGLEIPLSPAPGPGRPLQWVLLPSVEVTWFPDAHLGPGAYVGGAVALGLTYSLSAGGSS